MKKILYGGAVTGLAEERAIIRSIKKSRKTRNWQLGEEGKLFEEEAAKFIGVKHGILTVSGSCAGLLALSALELPENSEVIIPAVTFPTIFNIIVQCKLIPVVVDCEVGTYNLSLPSVEKAISKKTRAIIAVHALGNPVDMVALNKIAKKHKLYVLEDFCDGWGSQLNDKYLGSFSDISFTSYHAAHIVSMGVGGAVFSNSDDLARRVRQYRDWGRQANLADKWNDGRYPQFPNDQDARFIYEKIGYNFQPLELQAAMGRVQLRKTNRIKKLRQRNFNYIYKRLRKWDFLYLTLPRTIKGADVCWFSFPIFLKEGKREHLVKYLEAHGIETRSLFAGNITKHPAYKGLKIKHTDLTGANNILRSAFWVSCHPRYSKKDLDYMLDLFDRYFEVK